MAYLIDGYNLLFAYLGSPPSRKHSKSLQRGRRRLLELIRAGHAGSLSDVTIVFDAAHAPANVPAELDYHGIHVTFAVNVERADDAIEALVRRAPAPRQLTVVSDDRHIQQAARRRHCVVQGCAAYLDALEQHPPAVEGQPTAPVGKPEHLSVAETRDWLGEFGDLEDDPAMRELADPYGFETDMGPSEK